MCSTSETSMRATTVTSSDSTEDDRSAETMGRNRRNRNLLAALACVGALTACAAPLAAAAPRAHSSIVGGGRADPAQWPYAVAIFRKGHLHCGGSVNALT